MRTKPKIPVYNLIMEFAGVPSDGNLASKGGTSLGYGAQSAGCADGALNKPHAAITYGSNSYCYDLNGSQVKRNIGGSVYTLSYNAENRLTGVSGAATASFLYDGDGSRVKGVVSGTTTYYIGSHFEYSGSTGKKYFYAGSTLIGMRVGTGSGATNLTWLVGDHLGSTSKAANGTTGAQTSSQTYKAWGENRWPTTSTLPTTVRYTGQRHEPGLGGIYFYGSRWWDPSLGRFLSADTIIPLASQGVQAWDRYAGMNNNPVRYNDPSGHAVACASDVGNGCEGFGPARIIESYGATYDSQGMDQALRNFVRSHKTYSSYSDPFLDDTDRFFVANAQFQVAAEERDFDSASAYGVTLGILGVMLGGSDLDGPPVGPGIIYRAGRANPGNLKPRPSDEGILSFRDSISNPWPLEEGQRPVFSQGDDFIAVDSNRLPAGSVIFDNEPPGHVSINGFLASVEAIKEALLGIFRFPR